MATVKWVGISTTDSIAGYKIKFQFPLIVSGCEGMTIGYSEKKYEQIMHSRHKLDGEFEETIDEHLSRNALREMIARAIDQGANAVIGVRLTDKGEKKHFVRAYGTPVIMEKSKK